MTWTGYNWADCFRVKLFCLIDLKCQPSCDYSLIEGCSRTQKCGTVVLWRKLENMDELGLGFGWGLNENQLFVCNRGDTIQYRGGLQSRELGQAPSFQVKLFLTGYFCD